MFTFDRVHQTRLMPEVRPAPRDTIERGASSKQIRFDVVVHADNGQVATLWEIASEVQTVDMNEPEVTRSHELGQSSLERPRLIDIARVDAAEHRAP